MAKIYLQKTSEKGQADGYAGLGSDGKVPLAQSLMQGNATPPDIQNLLAWSIDPAVCTNANAPAAGVVCLTKIPTPKRITIGKIALSIGTAGTGATSLANCFFGIYNAAGTRLGVTADQSAALATATNKLFAVTQDSGQSLTVGGVDGDFVYGAILIGTQSTTALTIGRTPASTGNMSIGYTAAPYRAGTLLSGQTSLPTSITPANMAVGQGYMMGLAA